MTPREWDDLHAIAVHAAGGGERGEGIARELLGPRPDLRVAHDPGLHLAIFFVGACSGAIVGALFVLVVVPLIVRVLG